MKRERERERERDRAIGMDGPGDDPPEKGQGGSSIQEKPQQESKDELVEMYETVLAEERQRRDAAERMLEQQERAATQHLAQVMVKTDAVARPASESAPVPTIS